MDPIEYLRGEIKSHFTESTELRLSASYAKHRRYNFYFTLTEGNRFLLYLGWDGEGDRFTLKCLEFSSTELLDNLIESYPDTGSKIFNVGQPKTVVDFIFHDEIGLSVTEFKGSSDLYCESNEISVKNLMEYVDPGVTA